VCRSGAAVWCKVGIAGREFYRGRTGF